MTANKNARHPKRHSVPRIAKRRSNAFNPRMVVLVAFGLSGSAALLYELIWSRMLQLVFGSTVHTASTVLSGFLLGFSIGSLGFGRISTRIPRPLIWMALMQWAVVVYSLGLTAILTIASAKGAWIPEALPLKSAAVITLLLPPTILFGGLWPLFTRYFVKDPESLGTNMAGTYFVNSVGSALGAFAGGFILVPLLGIMATTFSAAAVNFVAGLMLISVDRTQHETR